MTYKMDFDGLLSREMGQLKNINDHQFKNIQEEADRTLKDIIASEEKKNKFEFLDNA